MAPRSFRFPIIIIAFMFALIASCSPGGDHEDPTGSGGNEVEITSLQFGEDANSNGDIPNPVTTFGSNEDEVYYLVKFNKNFGARKRIRKRWFRDGQELFNAIQTVEEEDRRIFGILKKHDQTALGTGSYVLEIEVWDDGYDSIPNNTGTTGFAIQSSSLQPYSRK